MSAAAVDSLKMNERIGAFTVRALDISDHGRPECRNFLSLSRSCKYSGKWNRTYIFVLPVFLERYNALSPYGRPRFRTAAKDSQKQ
jgi:hypothetical protein